MAKYGMSMCVLGMAEELRKAGHRRQRAVAAHRHRHRRACRTARRATTRSTAPQARDHGRRGARDPHAALPRVHRQLLHRRGGAAPRRRDRLRGTRWIRSGRCGPIFFWTSDASARGRAGDRVRAHGDGPLLRPGPRRPRRRSHQDRAAEGRQHAPPRARGVGLLPGVQPEQEEPRGRPAASRRETNWY